MIRILFLCIALMAAQVAGQSVCTCELAEHAGHNHATHGQLHSEHCHHAPLCPGCYPAVDDEHHHCDCHNGSQPFIAKRSNAGNEDVVSDALTSDVGFEVLHSPDHRRQVLKTGALALCDGESVRARLGLWLL